jgi:type VI secretion system secreted protein Hcp
MAHMAYMTLRGQRQGDIKGGVTQKGREGSIALIDVGYEIETPFDAALGGLTGRRKHSPLVIRKAIDEASPKLFEALVTNETLTSVKIEFGGPTQRSFPPISSSL